MAKLEMMNIQLIAFLQDSAKIMDYLQRKGCVEIVNSGETASFYKITTQSDVSRFEQYLSSARTALLNINTFLPKKKGLLDSFSARKEISVSQFADFSAETDKTLDLCYEINSQIKQITDEKANIVRLKTQIDSLTPWKNLSVSMKLKSTAQTKVFIGTLPEGHTRESLLNSFAELTPESDLLDIEIVSSRREQTCIFLVCHTENASSVESALRTLKFSSVSDTSGKTPAQRIEQYTLEIKDSEKNIENSILTLKSMKDVHEKIEFLIDYLLMKKEKYDSLSRLSMSERLFILEGFVPEKKGERLREYIEENFCAAVSLTQTDPEDENVPVLLENNKFSGAVESITKMYSMPGRADVDPNPVMAFFYYALFGLMLSDAGYGLLMVIAMLIAKKKLKLEENMKKTVNMFLYCGISTMFWGTLFGSWFGDIIPVIYTNFLNKPAPSLALWLEPVNEPMTLLLYCFLFGIIHLFAGLGVRFYQLWKSGKRLDAICDVVFVYLLVGGIAPVAASIITPMPEIAMTIGKYAALVGLAGVILTSGRSSKNIIGKLGGGLYGVYNIASGYLGDVLSYSRLLALGLSTGVIASVFNLLGTMPSNIVLKGIMLFFVFIIGHSINIGINLIGTYVHTNRLHYVEFFSKFYEGGGRSFTPLSVNTKYYKFKEEQSNE